MNQVAATCGDEAVQQMAHNSGFPVPPSEDSSRKKAGGSHDEQLHRLSSTFAPFPDPDLAVHQTLRELAEEARSVAGPGGCVIGLLEGNDFVCRAAAGESAPSLGSRIQTQDELFLECIHFRQLQISQDTLSDPRVDASACRAAGVRSLILVPLVAKNEELIGVLEASSPDSHAFGAAVSERMEVIGRRIVAALAPTEDHSQTPSVVLEEHTGPGRTLTRALAMSQEAPRFHAPKAQIEAPLPTPASITTRSIPTRATPDELAPVAAVSTLPEPIPAAPILATPPQPEAIPGVASQATVSRPYTPPQQSSQNLVLAVGVLAAGAVLAALLWRVQQEKLRQDVQVSASAAAVSSEVVSSQDSGQPVVPPSDKTGNQESTSPGRKSEPALEARGQHVSLVAKSSIGTNPATRNANPGNTILSSGDIVVYEKGKLIYRGGQTIRPPTASSSGSVTAPMTAASETERLGETSNPTQETSAPSTVSPETFTGGTLVHRVNPAYPTEALAARLEGDVVLQAVIGKDGGVHEVRVVTGDPRLAAAAVEAVRYWRYDPFRSHGEPVDMLSTLTVHFRLPRAPNQ